MEYKTLDTNNLIDPLLERMEKECNELRNFIATKDYPYHKIRYVERIANKAANILLLAGEVKAIYQLANHTITENEYSDSETSLIDQLAFNCE